MNEFSTQKNFHGAVLVATNGKVDFLQSTGIADREQNTLLNSESKFRIASITKAFTAALVMKLFDEDKISLDKTIGDYLPEYNGPGKDKIKIHHLLTYSSGLEDKLSDQGTRPYQTRISLNEFIDIYCSGDLIYEPGEKSIYGNTEYIILHKIIEVVSEESYENYLDRVILEPLGMTNSGMTISQEINSNLSSAYLYDDSLKTFYKENPYYIDLYFGAGAMYSTVEDILKFDQALFNHQILSEESTAKMLEIYPELGYTAYGLWGSTGWGNFNEKFYYRTGSIQGSNANWIHTVDNGKTIIVLSNTNGTNLFDLSEKLYLASLKK